VIENRANLGDRRLAWFAHGGMTGIPVKVTAVT